MVKKIFALVMVMSILGGIMAGCGEKAEEGTTAETTTGATTGGTTAGDATDGE